MNAAISPTAAERAQRAFRDGSALRVVGRAHLQVDHADQAWGAQQALEDGLNTADFADCGRLIVVRSLHLRRLDAGARGPAFARAIEAAWRALAPQAAAFDAPAAASAPAVYFRSAGAARIAWLQRFAASRPVDAWFWRSALPELAATSPGAPEEAATAVLARVLLDDAPAFAAALAQWPTASVQRLLAGRLASVILAWARWPADALRQALVKARNALPRGSPAPAEQAAATQAPAPAEASAVVVWLASLASPDDAPLAALATLVLAPADPAAIAIEQVAAIAVQARVQRSQPMRDADVPATAPVPPARFGQPDAMSLSHRSDRRLDHIDPHRQAVATPRAPTPLPITALPVPARVQASHRPNTAHWPWLAGNEPTAHGGLLMLLNVLRRMAIEAWLATQTPADRQALVALLFETLADRLRLPADDPQRVLFAAAEPLRGDAAARDAIDDWVRRLRRTLRLHARIGLASLVQRDAGIAITATHVDVVMPLHAADLRLRRAGLDSDPGWLPWFGWIVKLHYVVD